MTQIPVLTTPDFSIPFTLEKNAPSSAMDVILLQNTHPIAYYSKVLCPRLQRAFTYFCELHIITVSVCKWRHYLLGNSFTILTNYKSLKDIMLQVIQTPKQQTYMSKILGYDYTIKYKVGSTNVVANALSRILAPEEMHLFSLSMSNSVILGKFRQALVQDPQYDALLRQIHQQPETRPDLSMHKDVIFRQGNIWLPFTT